MTTTSTRAMLNFMNTDNITRAKVYVQLPEFTRPDVETDNLRAEVRRFYADVIDPSKQERWHSNPSNVAARFIGWVAMGNSNISIDMLGIVLEDEGIVFTTLDIVGDGHITQK